jgi:hypothetical protein
MASFDQHLLQAKNNLLFLKEINNKSNFFDWQVTTCFYVAVHLVNAHLAKCHNIHYSSHKITKQAMNPHNTLAPCKIDIDVFDTYCSLEKLSRRSRYLCNDSLAHEPNRAFLTYEKHVKRAISRLNVIMMYFNKVYGTTFEKVEITCPKIKAEMKNSIEYFQLA